MPTRKVAAGGIGGSLTIILVYVLKALGVSVDAILSSALTTLVCVALAWFVPELDQSQPVTGQKASP